MAILRTAPDRPAHAATATPHGNMAGIAIDLENWGALSRWAEYFGVGVPELLRATKAVGPSASAVERWLAREAARRDGG